MTNEFLRRMQWMEHFSWKMELEAAGMLVREQFYHFQEYIFGDREGFVWTNMLMPPELIYGAGLIPLQTELFAGWLSSLKLSQYCIQKAHSAGWNSNICSYHKAVIGALEAGILPPPSIAVFSTHLCDGGSLMARYLHQRYGTRVFIIEVPYERDGTNSLHHLKEQIQSAIEFLGNAQLLKKAVKLSNKASCLLRKANRLRASKYLFEGHLAIRNLYGASFMLGSEKGVKVADTYYRELRQKKESSHGGARILWIHFAPLYDSNLMHTFEKKLGMKIAFDITGYIYWEALDENNVEEALAKKMLSHFFVGDFERRKVFYEKLICEYQINGIVLFQHQNCRAISCSSWELRELSEKLHIPYLEISGDCIDPGNYAKAQMSLRMEAFAERNVHLKK